MHTTTKKLIKTTAGELKQLIALAVRENQNILTTDRVLAATGVPASLIKKMFNDFVREQREDFGAVKKESLSPSFTQMYKSLLQLVRSFPDLELEEPYEVEFYEQGTVQEQDIAGVSLPFNRYLEDAELDSFSQALKKIDPQQRTLRLEDYSSGVWVLGPRIVGGDDDSW